MYSSERTVEEVASLCPECSERVPSLIVERDGKVYQRSQCLTHRATETLIFSDSSLYRKLDAWNELIFAVMFLNSEELMTLPVGLYTLVGQFVIKWTDIATGSIIAVLPPLLLFAYIQRYLVQGLASGAVKG